MAQKQLVHEVFSLDDFIQEAELLDIEEVYLESVIQYENRDFRGMKPEEVYSLPYLNSKVIMTALRKDLGIPLRYVKPVGSLMKHDAIQHDTRLESPKMLEFKAIVVGIEKNFRKQLEEKDFTIHSGVLEYSRI